MNVNQDYISKVPQRSYPSTLDRQLAALETDELVLRFAASREKLAADRYRPVYHYVNPEGALNDPNGLCYWQGRYHLFYQAYPPEDPRQHWGHAVSDDLVYWRDLPLAIYPGIEEKCFSGSTLVEDGRVIAMYHGPGAGNMVAVSTDPLLLNWENIPGNPVIAMTQPDQSGRPYRVFDPCIWSEEEGYYALSGRYWDGPLFDGCRMVQHLFFSQDLTRWTYMGPFVEGDIFTAPGEDGAVPYFWPIGDKHILLFASHLRGSQYLLGDYDKTHTRLRPYAHGRFNFGSIDPGGVHAPSATPDGDGGVYVIHNINAGKPTEGWDHIMSLPRLLTLGEDDTLCIEPIPPLEKLRSDHRHVGAMPMPANRDIPIDGVYGSSTELAVKIDPQDARGICIKVLRSPNDEEYTAIQLHRQGGFRKSPLAPRSDALSVDISRSSLSPEVMARPPEVAPFELEDDEPLDLRVFVDKSVVEVFANGRQAIALRVYPEREDSVGVSIRAQGRDAALLSLDAWRMKSIWA